MMRINLEFNLQPQKPHYHRDIYQLSSPVTPVKGGWRAGTHSCVIRLSVSCRAKYFRSNKKDQINLVYLNGILNPVISFLWCRVAACLLASNTKIEEGKKGSICAHFDAHAPCVPVFSVYVYYLWICDSSGVEVGGGYNFVCCDPVPAVSH